LDKFFDAPEKKEITLEDDGEEEEVKKTDVRIFLISSYDF